MQMPDVRQRKDQDERIGDNVRDCLSDKEVVDVDATIERVWIGRMDRVELLPEGRYRDALKDGSQYLVKSESAPHLYPAVKDINTSKRASKSAEGESSYSSNSPTRNHSG